MKQLTPDKYKCVAFISELKVFVGPFLSRQEAKNWAYANLDGESMQLISVYSPDQYNERYAK